MKLLLVVALATLVSCTPEGREEQRKSVGKSTDVRCIYSNGGGFSYEGVTGLYISESWFRFIHDGKLRYITNMECVITETK